MLFSAAQNSYTSPKVVSSPTSSKMEGAGLDVTSKWSIPVIKKENKAEASSKVIPLSKESSSVMRESQKAWVAAVIHSNSPSTIGLSTEKQVKADISSSKSLQKSLINQVF